MPPEFLTLVVTVGLPLLAVVISILVAQPQLRHSMEQRIDELQAQVRACNDEHGKKDARLAECETRHALADIEMARQELQIERLANAIVQLGGDLGDYRV